MAEAEGGLIHPDSAKKLGAFFRRLDQNPLTPSNFQGEGYGRTTSVVQVVRVTGSALAGFSGAHSGSVPVSGGGSGSGVYYGYTYPGVVENWNNLTQEWETGPACHIREVNNSELSSRRYLGKLVGQDIAEDVDYPVFQVQLSATDSAGSGSGDSGASGSGGSGSSGSTGSFPGGSGMIEVVTNVECIDNILVQTKRWIYGAFAD